MVYNLIPIIYIKLLKVKYLEVDYCKIHQIAYPKYHKCVLRFKNYNTKNFRYNYNFFHNLFNSLTLICCFLINQQKVRILFATVVCFSQTFFFLSIVCNVVCKNVVLVLLRNNDIEYKLMSYIKEQLLNRLNCIFLFYIFYGTNK